MWFKSICSFDKGMAGATKDANGVISIRSTKTREFPILLLIGLNSAIEFNQNYQKDSYYECLV